MTADIDEDGYSGPVTPICETGLGPSADQTVYGRPVGYVEEEGRKPTRVVCDDATVSVTLRVVSGSYLDAHLAIERLSVELDLVELLQTVVRVGDNAASGFDSEWREQWEQAKRDAIAQPTDASQEWSYILSPRYIEKIELVDDDEAV